MTLLTDKLAFTSLFAVYDPFEILKYEVNFVLLFPFPLAPASLGWFGFGLKYSFVKSRSHWHTKRSVRI
jgi:hypothetical protein